jgi:hypothetical protein
MNRNGHIKSAPEHFASPFSIAQEIPGPAAVIDTGTINIDLFEEEDPMVITLGIDKKAYQRNKRKDEILYL